MLDNHGQPNADDIQSEVSLNEFTQVAAAKTLKKKEAISLVCNPGLRMSPQIKAKMRQWERNS